MDLPQYGSAVSPEGHGGANGTNIAGAVFQYDDLGDAIRWYVACIASGMLNMLTAPELTLVFMGIVVGLGTAVVWLLWEIEQSASRSPGNSDR